MIGQCNRNAQDIEPGADLRPVLGETAAERPRGTRPGGPRDASSEAIH
jgi:hypothetical protein